MNALVFVVVALLFVLFFFRVRFCYLFLFPSSSFLWFVYESIYKCFRFIDGFISFSTYECFWGICFVFWSLIFCVNTHFL